MKTARLQTAMFVFALIGLGALSFSPASGQDAGSVSLGEMGITGADPSIIETEDGFVSVESRSGRTLFVRIAPTLAELADARPTRIWSDRDGLGDVWAPEIVRRDGRYEVYFAAGAGEAHRMYVVSSATPDADYGNAIEIALPDDKWAIDGMPLTYEGKSYFVWSGWQGNTDVQQDIFIAEMTAGGQVLAPRVKISSPDRPWENIGWETPSINEGPQPIVDPDGRLHIVYSANGSWGENYCLADLRLMAGADPLEAAAWRKSDGCLFGANPATLADDGTLVTLAKGVGHHSFVLPDGNLALTSSPTGALPFAYHGVPADEQPRNFWEARKWFIGTFSWAPDVDYGNAENPDLGWAPAFAQ